MTHRPFHKNIPKSKLTSLALGLITTLLFNAASVQNPKRALQWKNLSFSGYEWAAKSTVKGRKGPGPNLFSSSSDNVWVDQRGYLHLGISYERNRWWCAEVATRESLGYGSYRFHVAKLDERLDDQVVLGMFTWDDNPAQAHREIDIELSVWGENISENTHFIVQPHHKAQNKKRLYSPITESPLIYGFEWTPSKIEFQIIKQDRSSSQNDQVVQTWIYTGPDIPTAGDAKARISFWLYKGKPPKTGVPQEVVITRFDFTPFSIEEAMPASP